jgi:hypothetical protein
MTYKLICPVKNNQVIVTLPADFSGKKEVTVVVDDQIDNKRLKFEQLKMASADPLFLADVEEIHQDFSSIDNEIL